MLNLIDEHTRESLLVRAERRWSSARVIEALADVMVWKGVPQHIRSDNGPEFVARDLRKWLANTGTKTLYIEPGSPWENGYCESFNSKLRERVPERRDLLLAEGNQGARGAVAGPLQHCQAALLAGLQAAGAGGLAGKEHGAWRSGNRCALPTSPHPRLRRND
jgi:transposase InsO family protein